MMERPPQSAALDEYLVVECQLGNAEAFGALVRRWHGRFVLRARELTKDHEAAADVAQESWIGVIRGLPRLRDPARFRSWAMSIVANKSRDWIRRARTRRGVTTRALVDAPGRPVHDQGLGRVRDGLAALEPGHRTLLRRRYLEGHPVAEIASQLGIPEGTVKSRLSTARKQLRRKLEED